MSKKSAGKRKKTDNESLSSVINEINTITSTECSKSRKTRPGRPAKSKATDIEFERDETGQRIFHIQGQVRKPLLLSCYCHVIVM